MLRSSGMSIKSQLRSKLYTWMWSPQNPVSTYYGYEKILETIPNGSSILDVGVGDGIYFTNPAVVEMIKGKSIKIHGIDIDDGALVICKERITSSGIDDVVSVSCTDVLEINDRFDYALFIESYPVIPIDTFDRYISHIKQLVNKQLVMFHNLVEKKDKWLEFMKPRIRRMTGVDFGVLTSSAEMREHLARWGFDKFDISLSLSAKYSEMNKWLGIFPAVGDMMCDQFIISINVD